MQIRRGIAFGEPTINRCQKVAGFGAAALVAAEAGEAHGGAQLPELCLLEISVGERWKRRLVDLILAKCRLEALQPETAQPGRYVRGRSTLTPAPLIWAWC